MTEKRDREKQNDDEYHPDIPVPLDKEPPEPVKEPPSPEGNPPAIDEDDPEKQRVRIV